ncbi:unnamed protein product, partial [Closterium sp. NIES-54]
MISKRATAQQQPTNVANDLATAPSEPAFQLRGSAAVGETRTASGDGSEAIKDLSGPPVLCWERVGGSTKAYVANDSGGGADGAEGAGRGRNGRRRKPFFIQDVGERADAVMELTDFFKTNFLPEGFPDSVAPSFVPYMRWRALQYFFGGAMGVFTTRSLLHALGVSRGAGGGGAAASALAVNWVLKDGAGRLGKMLFARHGKRFDCDLKQMRFLSNMLLDFGCCVELCTMAAPKFFLPLACVANVFKNIGAVTNTSTRAPIYKAFARRENIGDITAKGESISNLADL